jgi:cell division protein FtsN
MAQDYAKKRKPAAGKRAQPASRGSRGNTGSPRRWFFAGLVCGIFLSALVWLAGQQPELAQTVAVAGKTAVEKDNSPKPTFDFYTLLPEQQVEVDVEPLRNEPQRRPATDQYLLQAGSFKLAADADRRRAELLLLGLEARVQEATGSNGRWFRVYIGPFENRSRLERARSLTAQQGIDTLLMKRPGKG